MPAWYGARRLLTLDDTTPVAFWRASFGSLTGILTLTRASSAVNFDSSGNYQLASSDVARFDYTADGAATFMGLLVESARTNSLRNAVLAGASAGSPGTLPTNWIDTGVGTLTRTIATGTEYGMAYVEIRLNGTSSLTGTNYYQEATNNIAALTGQTWAASMYYRMTAGSTANITSINLNIRESNAAGAALASNGTAVTAPTSSLQRAKHTRTLNQATTAFVTQFWSFSYSSGVAIDITMRFYLPKLEQGAFVLSPYPTSGAAAGTAADVLAAASYTTHPAIIQYRAVSTGTRARKVINPWSGVSSETDEWIEEIAIYPIGTSAGYLNSRLTVDGPY
jgi:hypothetical protein